MTRSRVLVSALWVSIAACEMPEDPPVLTPSSEPARTEPASAAPASSEALPSAIPAGYPLPAKGRSLHDAVVVGERQSFEFQFEGADVAALAEELRSGLVDGGWPITYSDKQGERVFLSTERDGTLVDATVFPAPNPTITVAVQPAVGTVAKAGAPPPATDRERMLDEFPKPEGGIHDPGYSSGSSDYPSRLYEVPARPPADVVAWLPDAASKSGYRCILTNQRDTYTCLRDGQKEWIAPRIVDHPLGGTAYFISVLPGE